MEVDFGGQKVPVEVAYRTDFSTMDDFWVEGSPKAEVRDNKLCVETTMVRDKKSFDWVQTVFLKKVFKGDLLVEFKAQSVSDDSRRNFNCFIHTTGPKGKDLFETRAQRTGDYGDYHVLDNYLFTCLPSDQKNPDGSDKMRYRMRRDPGFVLKREEHDYKCENFRWYKLQYLVRKGKISICVDGLPEETYSWDDDQPLTSGYVGFRTYMSKLEFKDFVVYQVKE